MPSTKPTFGEWVTILRAAATELESVRPPSISGLAEFADDVCNPVQTRPNDSADSILKVRSLLAHTSRFSSNTPPASSMHKGIEGHSTNSRSRKPPRFFLVFSSGVSSPTAVPPSYTAPSNQGRTSPEHPPRHGSEPCRRVDRRRWHLPGGELFHLLAGELQRLLLARRTSSGASDRRRAIHGERGISRCDRSRF